MTWLIPDQGTAHISFHFSGFQVICQPLQTLRPAHLHTFEVLRRHRSLMKHLCVQSQSRFAVLLSKSDRVSDVEHRIAVFIERAADEYNSFRFDDFLEHTFHGIDDAVRSAHVDTDLAARTQVQLANRVGESVRSPPLRHLFGISPGSEDNLPGRVEDAGDRQIPFRLRLCGSSVCALCGHASSPYSSRYCSGVAA